MDKKSEDYTFGKRRDVIYGGFGLAAALSGGYFGYLYILRSPLIDKTFERDKKIEFEAEEGHTIEIHIEANHTSNTRRSDNASAWAYPTRGENVVGVETRTEATDSGTTKDSGTHILEVRTPEYGDADVTLRVY